MQSHPIRIISGELIRELAPPSDLRQWMAQAMVASSAGRAVMPLRRALVLPDGKCIVGMMPGYLTDARAAGVKLVSLVPSERRRGSSHLGLMVLYDEEGLVPIALLCGATITAVRTAAVSALATDHLARRSAKVLAILGTGEQAKSHIEALTKVRPFEELRVWGRRPAEVERFVNEQAARLLQGQAAQGVRFRACVSVAHALEGADVVCTLTSSPEPILPGALLCAGMHVNLVGSSSADAAEADDDVVARSRFFIDWRESALNQAGELLGAISRGVVTADHIQGELGAVIAGDCPGRRSDDEITVYKSLGVAAQDVMTARRVFDRAQARGLGSVVEV